MLAIAGFTAFGIHAAPSVYPVGTTLYQPDQAWNGFTVLSLLRGPVVVIDMNGHVVKQWTDFNTYAGGPARVLPNGEVIAPVGARPGRQESTRLVQEDFQGKQLWSLDGEQMVQQAGSNAKSLRQHHDWQRADFPSGYYSPESRPASSGSTTLVLEHVDRIVPAISRRMLQDDHLVEYGPDGKIRWQWFAADHVDEFGFSTEARAAIRNGGGPPAMGPGAGGAVAAGPRAFDWLHTNSATYLGPNRWFDAGDKRFAPENILISSRQASFVAIIARDGHVVWLMGPDYRTSPELRRIGQIIGQHHAHLIPKGLPGAGNLLLFDNGGASGYGVETPVAPAGENGLARAASRVLEIDPVKMELVWSYTAPGFYSANISGAQRLANGNTLVTEGAGARVFEVTAQKRIVWEYMSAGANGASEAVYRAYRLPYDWIPQLEKPVEQPVTPPAGYHLP